MCIVVHVRVTGVCAIAHFARGRKRGKDGVIIFVKGLYFSSKAMMMTFPGRARIFSTLAFFVYLSFYLYLFSEKKNMYKEIIYYDHKKKRRKRIEYGNCQLTNEGESTVHDRVPPSFPGSLLSQTRCQCVWK